MLAIFRQKALRLASIEGRKLLRQPPTCLRLVIVRVGDEMDLDTLSIAAHCGIHAPTPTEAQREEELFDRDSRSV